MANNKSKLMHLASRLKTFDEYLKVFITKHPVQSDAKPSQVEFLEFEERYSKAITLLDDYTTAYYGMKFKDDEIKEAQQGFIELEAQYYKVIAQAKEIRFNHGTQDKKEAIDATGTHSTVLNNQNLPIIPLPNFDGNFDLWLEFRSTFESLIHLNKEISTTIKFYYLRSALKGPPLEIIHSIDFTPENYGTAWELLCERYNNKKLLIHNHIKALTSLESFTKESAVKLRKMVDDISKHLRILTTLEEPTDKWDSLLIHLFSEKIDPHTFREWESKQRENKEMPNLDDFLNHLRNKASFLETIEQKVKPNALTVLKKEPQKATKALITTGNDCVYCEKNHYIYSCPDFRKLTVQGKSCGGNHHTWLHYNNRLKNDTASRPNKGDNNTAICGLANHTPTVQVLLSTAIVYVRDRNNKIHKARALLDSGSQSSFITQRFCQKLNLQEYKFDMSVTGIGKTQSTINARYNTVIETHRGDYKTKFTLLIVPQITSYIPNFTVNSTELIIPKNIRLADPKFYEPNEIDLLLGAEHFFKFMCVGNISLGHNKPTLQKTVFGWIISGILSPTLNTTTHCNFAQANDISTQLENFWKIEECENKQIFAPEELHCERHFCDNIVQDEDGRLNVSIPFKISPSVLGESREQAKRRFLALERKMFSNKELRTEYVKFMREYEDLDHMTRIDDERLGNVNFYLPHHAVLKEGSSTTKLRVVFDASAKSSSGYSLNDIQMVGPTIQRDLLSILLNFRKHKYVISADVTKMYRQVRVKPQDRSLQRILWRENPEENIICYELNTVTYGTSSAAFLAIRCLHKLAENHESQFTKASNVIKNCFYVDDLLTGGESVAEVKQLKDQITYILLTGKFELRKWCANDKRILENEIPTQRVQISSEKNKTLGIAWNPDKDTLSYNIKAHDKNQKVTKRIILSTVAQIFDPLGLLSPTIILFKIMLQELWKLKLAWDETIPSNIHTSWTALISDLQHISKLQIKRHVLSSNSKYTELHGFSDASTDAYGACVYVRTTSEKGDVSVNLLTDKTKVAPLKPLTIPKLELCAAVILSRLISKVIKGMAIVPNEIVLWCDSTIVLCWIKSPASQLKLFVSNRVAEIQETTEGYEWRHVPTKDNPADLLTRGIKPDKLEATKLWWEGPEWLRNDEIYWPKIKDKELDVVISEIKKNTIAATTNINQPIIDIKRYSNLNLLEGIMGYCLRFIENCKCRNETRESRKTGLLTSMKRKNALNTLIKIAQNEIFFETIEALNNTETLPKSNKLLSLHPFLDEHDVLRVGGRLRNSSYAFEKKHPAILHAKHRLTILIFEREHLKLMHAGPRAILCSVREKIWPIAGQNLSKRIVRQCVKCCRYDPKPMNPIMGNLPKERTQRVFPFQVTGVDYAGPFSIKREAGRKSIMNKGYICVFVCFATKAHLELVTSLTKEAFISTLRRFIARRGCPSQIYSDNGTNFTSAYSELKEFGSFINKNQKDIHEACSKLSLQWSFIPARAPHFGGIWEAGVKAVKFHIKRVLGNASLNYEEFYSVIVQIESILNSRPLTPLSNSPDDLLPLTPAHFLIGRTFTELPDMNVDHIPTNRLSNYQRIQQLKQNFWRRWSKEYISEMQQRSKWKKQRENLKLNDMVLVKEDNLHPASWLLGRVIDLHPGADGVVRVVTIRTARGQIRRAVVKLCVLPTSDSERC